MNKLTSFIFILILACVVQTKGQTQLFNDYPSQLTLNDNLFNKIKLLKTQGSSLELIIDTDEGVKIKGTAVSYVTHDDGSETISVNLTEFPQNTNLIVWKNIKGTGIAYQGLIRNFKYKDAYRLVESINGKLVFIKVDLESMISD
jgi:hypothetical protein